MEETKFPGSSQFAKPRNSPSHASMDGTGGERKIKPGIEGYGGPGRAAFTFGCHLLGRQRREKNTHRVPGATAVTGLATPAEQSAFRFTLAPCPS